MSDYERVAAAIEFINEHISEQPSLDQVAAHVNLSPQHFQRMFSRWAGISPKRFLQTLTVENAKERLEKSSIWSVSNDLGLSSSARLHDHFVSLEGITPGEYRSKGQGLQIFYGLHDSPFGKLFIATTSRGICKLTFLDQDQRQTQIEQAIMELEQQLSCSEIQEEQSLTQTIVDKIFSPQRENLSIVAVGTNFQINVWKALLKIPFGQLCTYGQIAELINKPTASRAVGNAVGANPISLIIPCHRVIQATGVIGNYRWGKTRKKAMLTYEAL